MIPLKLTLSGIYSYQEEAQIIDFKQLTSESLFGIFGAVGSGKSTILETIIYALYNRVERIGGTGFKYDLMNLRSNRLWIDFEFLAGEEDEHYRITVESKRNVKDFKDVKTATRNLYKKNGNQWIPIDMQKNDAIIENIIGLKYENFRRVIIIPQGKFQEFLQLSGSERATMLKELFKELQQYDLSEKTGILLKATELELENINGNLSQLEEFSQEVLEKMQQEFLHLQVRKKEIEAQLKLLMENNAFFEKIYTMFQERDKHMLELQKLEVQNNEMERNERMMNAYNECMLLFRSDLMLLQNIEKQLLETCMQQERTQKDYVVQKEAFEKIQMAFQSCEERYNARNELQNKIIQLRKVIEVDARQKALEVVHKKQLGLMDRERVGLDKIRLLEEEIAFLNEQYKQLSSATFSSDELMQLQQWYSKYEMLEKDRQIVAEKLTRLTKSDRELSIGLQTQASKFSFVQHTPVSLEELCEILKIKQKQFLQQLNQEKVVLQELHLKQKLSNYANALEEGVSCPLCGNTHHPIPLSSIDVDNDICLKNNEIKNYETVLYTISDVQIWIEKELQNQQIRNEDKAVCMQQLSDLENYIQEHKRQFLWNSFDYSDKVALESRLKDESRKISQVQKSQEIISKKEKTMIEYRNLKESIHNEIRNMDAEIASIQAVISTLKNDIDVILYNEYISMESEMMDAYIIQLQEQLLQIEKQYKKFLEEKERLNTIIYQLSGKLKNQEEIISQLQVQKANLNAVLNKKIVDSGYKSLIEVKLILDQNLNVLEIQNLIKKYRENVLVHQLRMNELNNQIGDIQYNEEDHKNIKQQIEEQNRLEEQITADFGSCKTQLKIIEQKLQEKIKLQKEHIRIENRKQNLDLLKGLFKGAGFVKYVSTMYLESLCINANERFRKMTQQQLELVLNGNGDFEVRDYLNEGKTRSIKTLSGGQTFQAALSLALALVDNIRNLSKASQKFFFLDEGFGSQDKDSLQIIFDTLKSLRNENRIVGIISHVEELQQNIPTFITVKKDKERGSIIL